MFSVYFGVLHNTTVSGLASGKNVFKKGGIRMGCFFQALDTEIGCRVVCSKLLFGASDFVFIPVFMSVFTSV